MRVEFGRGEGGMEGKGSKGNLTVMDSPFLVPVLPFPPSFHIGKKDYLKVQYVTGDS